MITDKEYQEVSLSPTKKDYYQIWNEILELATKISSRWSPRWTPDSTNESDPGIVLLKAAVAIADKLNYNIDKNTLEAFMPSATQQDSMRKLTEMMGYSMKYYQAASCSVNISYKTSNSTSLKDIGTIYFPKFVNLKNEEEDVNYVTVEDFTLQPSEPTRKVTAVEGELVECETDNDNIISLIHLDDAHRYILPEVNVAENAVFIFNVADSTESEQWKQTDNLNAVLPGTPCYKFGYDSTEGLPYIQFPDDISQLIKDGLRIKYIRTNGLSGNISRGTLTKLVAPGLWSTAENEAISGLTSDQFSVTNITAALNGANPETLNSAYNNFKKTVGTFDTLITCRDYMNKIYQLTMSDTDTTPLVSNSIVSDIRDDINKSTILCSFNEYGITYSDLSLKDADGSNLIDHFDLILYPFKTIYGLNRKEEFLNSFTYNAENVGNIKYDLEECKTIAHNIRTPGKSEIACIKNYLKLKARIATTKKVTKTEEEEILSNVFTNLYKNFNNRYIDGGQEIPYEALLEVIENADARIKDVNLDEPSLYTVIARCDGSEDELYARSETTGELTDVDKAYNKLALRNILAGRIAAFQYDNDFKAGFDESPYPGTAYAPTYPSAGKYISKLESKFTVNAAKVPEGGLVLNPNEVIQFRLPNFRTVTTYPCYTNYFVKLDNLSTSDSHAAVPATFISLATFMLQKNGDSEYYWNAFVNDSERGAGSYMKNLGTFSSETAFTDNVNKYGGLFTKSGNIYSLKTDYTAGTTYWAFEIKEASFAIINKFVAEQTVNGITLNGLYRSVGADLSRSYGKFVDINYVKYLRAYTYASASTVGSYYVQQTHSNSEEEINISFTADGIGLDANLPTIDIDSEYELTNGEYLLINYTKSSTDDTGTESKTIVNKYYGPGTIIKPNFGLMDSSLYHNNHSYSKKDGFYFVEQPNCPGMFSLGANEQILIRDFVQVDLDEAVTYLYWELNSDDPEANVNEFIFDEYSGRGVPDESNPGVYLPNAYTLKEGEHLYYTNAKKSDLVYYGAGTTIIKSAKTPRLLKYAANGEVSEEDIMTYGLAAGIPWGNAYNLSKRGDDDRKIIVRENQYVSLTEGDTLKYISNSTDDTKTFAVSFENNNWQDITSATYKFTESDSEDSLPKIKVGGLSWQARSRLDFNMGPVNPQILLSGDSITFYEKTINSNPDTPGDPTVLYPRSVEGGKKATVKLVFENATSTTDATTLTLIAADYGPDFNGIEAEITKKANNKFDLVFKNTDGLTVESYTDATLIQNTPSYIGNKLQNAGASGSIIARVYDVSTRYAFASSDIKLIGEFAGGDISPIAIFSNYICQAADDEINVAGNSALLKKLGLEINKDFKIKLASLQTPEFANGGGETVNLDNYVNGDSTFTKISFENLPDKSNITSHPAFTLKTNILSSDEYGLIMFYYKNDNYAENIKAKVVATAKDGYTGSDLICRFNYVQPAGTDPVNPSTQYEFVEGIQVLWVNKNVKNLTIYPDFHTTDASKAYAGILIFSDLSLVKGANTKLDYRYNSSDTTNNTALKKLLADIKNCGAEIANNFFYNITVDNSSAIELNPKIADDKLSSPLTWYDPNNANNKFVISEIDAEYLTTGITLTRASRL